MTSCGKRLTSLRRQSPKACSNPVPPSGARSALTASTSACGTADGAWPRRGVGADGTTPPGRMEPSASRPEMRGGHRRETIQIQTRPRLLPALLQRRPRIPAIGPLYESPKALSGRLRFGLPDQQDVATHPGDWAVSVTQFGGLEPWSIKPNRTG